MPSRRRPGAAPAAHPICGVDGRAWCIRGTCAPWRSRLPCLRGSAPAVSRSLRLPRPAPPRPEDEARAALARFAASLHEDRWPDAYVLLSARWRARLSPDRLAVDWRDSGPVGARALARVEALLAFGAPVRVSGSVASLAVGEGREASLVLEDGRWRVEALE